MTDMANIDGMKELWFAFTKRDGKAEFVFVVRKPDWIAAFDVAPRDYRSFGKYEANVRHSGLSLHRGYFHWKQSRADRQLLSHFR